MNKAGKVSYVCFGEVNTPIERLQMKHDEALGVLRGLGYEVLDGGLVIDDPKYETADAAKIDQKFPIVASMYEKRRLPRPYPIRTRQGTRAKGLRATVARRSRDRAAPSCARPRSTSARVRLVAGVLPRILPVKV